MNNTITVLTWARNEAQMMPFFMRYYGSFADRIIVFDNYSDDGTDEIVRAHPKGELRRWPTGGVRDEIRQTRAKETEYKKTGGGWKIVVDVDEFVWARVGMRQVLERCSKNGKNILRSVGFNMVSEEMPEDDGETQLTDLAVMGVRSPRYDKICVFRGGVDIYYDYGCHTCRSGPTGRATDAPVHSLLHYKFLGKERSIERARWTKEVMDKEQLKRGICSETADAEWHEAEWERLWAKRSVVIERGSDA